MAGFLLGLVFLSGMPLAVFVLPTSWWPWSIIFWFVGFVTTFALLKGVARRWQGQPRPAGLAGVVLGIAVAAGIAIEPADGGDAGDGGDSGGDGGGGD